MVSHGYELEAGIVYAVVVAHYAESMGGADAPLLATGWRFEPIHGAVRALSAAIIRSAPNGSYVILRVTLGASPPNGVITWSSSDLPMMGNYSESYRAPSALRRPPRPETGEVGVIVGGLAAVFGVLLATGLVSYASRD